MLDAFAKTVWKKIQSSDTGNRVVKLEVKPARVDLAVVMKRPSVMWVLSNKIKQCT